MVVGWFQDLRLRYHLWRERLRHDREARELSAQMTRYKHVAEGIAKTAEASHHEDLRDPVRPKRRTRYDRILDDDSV